MPAPSEETDAPAQGLPDLAFLKVPVVDAAFQTATDIYSFGKDKSSIIPGLAGVIDCTEKKVLEAATSLTPLVTPLINAHSETIDTVDKFATDKIETLVENVQTKYTRTKQAVGDTIGLLETTVAPTVDLTARLTDNIVEAVLPEPLAIEDDFGEPETVEEGETPRPEEPLPLEGGQPRALAPMTPELAEAMAKCTATMSKAKRRAYILAFQQLSSVRPRLGDAAAQVKNHYVDLISYAQGMVAVETEMVEVHREVANEAVEAIATATTEYVSQQRELLATFAQNPVGAARATVLRTIAKAETIQNFVRRQYEESPTREAFVRRMVQLREQAKQVQEQLAEGITEGVSRVRTVELVAKAESLYWDFEDAADPYTLSLLKRIRLQLGRMTGVSPSGETYVVTQSHAERLASFPRLEGDHDEDYRVASFAQPNPVFSVSDSPDQAMHSEADRSYARVADPAPEEDFTNDEGLFIRVRAKSPRNDIDLEDVLLPDSDRQY